MPVVGVEPTTYPLLAGGPGRIRTDDRRVAANCLILLATGPGTPGKNRTRSTGFGGQVVTMTLGRWLQGKDSNLRDLLQRQADYRYLTLHGWKGWIRTSVTTFKESQTTAI